MPFKLADMKLSRDEVVRIANLARLKLSDAEIDKFSSQLGDILEYVNMLNEIDTTSVEPTSQVTGLQNISEDDVVIDFVIDKGRLIKNSPLSIIDNQIQVKSVF